MKICFLLQRRFAYIGHYLAELLQERHGVEHFCGVVQTRASHEFLTTQKNIAYSALLLDEDIHKEYKSEKLDLDYLKQLERLDGIIDAQLKYTTRRSTPTGDRVDFELMLRQKGTG